PNTFNVNSSISPLSPIVAAGAFNHYTIAPGLPQGLAIDLNTGIISGIPQSVSPATDYTVTATNAGAVHNTAIINLMVQDLSLPKITYSPSSNVFTQNTVIAPLSPTITGGSVTATNVYTINPALPAGLVFDTKTGTIAGVPTAVTANTTYSIIANNTATATNPSAGNRYSTVQIKVSPAAKDSIGIYSPAEGYFMVDIPITPMKPPATDTSYSVFYIAPKLPDGLRLNKTNGKIYGTPTKAYPSRYYLITDTSIDRRVTKYVINITVAPHPDSLATPPTIEFVGQGDIQQSINTGAKIQANTGIGVIYRENSRTQYHFLHHIEVDFSINVASTVDTIKSINNAMNQVTNKQDFGNSVLLPLNSGQAFSFAFTGYFSERGGKNGNYQRNASPRSLGGVLSGFKVSVAGSNRNWEYDSLSYSSATPPVQTTTPTLVK
ncbi:MAG TPA: Ig domain-containing protein, partial [Bacteroidia bacterium]|nr:Ig domain-containing protein [Bacteroidia bacterium]